MLLIRRKVKLFNDNGEFKTGKIDPEKKKSDMDYINEKFGED